ncbi:flagellar motor switch protein G [Citrobacter koseri]|uniref:Flagellar motor switch protein G n=1 Tax=Citrobacter koseri TaxID=545 RepID=A0A3S4MA47_CITKO|nr:flagellar motor switch protein G [Citrobacter koseri]
MTEATVSRNDKNHSASAGRSRLEQAAILLMSVGEEAAAQVMQKLNREEVIVVERNDGASP